MDARRGAGAVLLVGGLLLAGVGVAGALTGGGSTGGTAAGPSATPAPSSVAVASPLATPPASPSPEPPPGPTPTPEPTPNPTPEPTPSEDALVRAFFADFIQLIRAGDVDALVPLLHPAVIDRYGEAQCRSILPTFADTTFNVVIRSVGQRAPWDYVTDTATTTIPDAWTVSADYTTDGETTTRDLHVAPIDGEVRWFTDCGTPLGAAPAAPSP